MKKCLTLTLFMSLFTSFYAQKGLYFELSPSIGLSGFQLPNESIGFLFGDSNLPIDYRFDLFDNKSRFGLSFSRQYFTQSTSKPALTYSVGDRIGRAFELFSLNSVFKPLNTRFVKVLVALGLCRRQSGEWYFIAQYGWEGKVDMFYYKSYGLSTSADIKFYPFRRFFLSATISGQYFFKQFESEELKIKSPRSQLSLGFNLGYDLGLTFKKQKPHRFKLN